MQPGAPSGRGTSLGLVYIGMAALCCAWLGLGRTLPSRRALLTIAAVWALPLALAPPLFSRDIYSYLAQGTILRLGHSPYHTAPAALAGMGHQHVLDAVSPFWRHTTAPYGPLFLGLLAVVSAVAGSHLVAGALLTRVLGLAGMVLLAIYVPRLARSLGSDGRRALWLVLLSPLVTLGLVAAGHNDLLMAGLLAAGVAYALDGRPLLGVAICALAATVKVPALAGAAFIAVAWGREELGRAGQARFIAGAALLALAVLGAVTLVTGVGVDWLSTSLFSTPAKVRLAITPATGLGYTAASLLSDVGIGVSHRGLEGVAGRRGLRGRRADRRGDALPRAHRAAGAVARGVPAHRGRGRPRRVAVVLHLGPGAHRRPARAAALARPGPGGRGVGVPGQAQRHPGPAPAVRARGGGRVSPDRRGGVVGSPPAPGRAASRGGARAQSVGAGRDLMTVGVQEPPGLVAATPAGVRDARGWGVIAIPAALAAVLSLIGLSGRSLGFDEGATASIAAQHGAALWHAIAHDGGNMSGYYLFMHVLTGAFGDGLVVLRLPSVVATVATVALIALIAQRLFADRRVALAAGVLAAVSLPLVYWAQTARGYAPMVAFVCAAYLAFIALTDTPAGAPAGPRGVAGLRGGDDARHVLQLRRRPRRPGAAARPGRPPWRRAPGGRGAGGRRPSCACRWPCWPSTGGRASSSGCSRPARWSTPRCSSR